jgi:hypothetical protein
MYRRSAKILTAFTIAVRSLAPDMLSVMDLALKVETHDRQIYSLCLSQG